MMHRDRLVIKMRMMLNLKHKPSCRVSK